MNLIIRIINPIFPPHITQLLATLKLIFNLYEIVKSYSGVNEKMFFKKFTIGD